MKEIYVENRKGICALDDCRWVMVMRLRCALLLREAGSVYTGLRPSESTSKSKE